MSRDEGTTPPAGGTPATSDADLQEQDTEEGRATDAREPAPGSDRRSGGEQPGGGRGEVVERPWVAMELLFIIFCATRLQDWVSQGDLSPFLGFPASAVAAASLGALAVLAARRTARRAGDTSTWPHRAHPLWPFGLAGPLTIAIGSLAWTRLMQDEDWSWTVGLAGQAGIIAVSLVLAWWWYRPLLRGTKDAAES